jgi:hypothetical protein
MWRHNGPVDGQFPCPLTDEKNVEMKQNSMRQ